MIIVVLKWLHPLLLEQIRLIRHQHTLLEQRFQPKLAWSRVISTPRSGPLATDFSVWSLDNQLTRLKTMHPRPAVRSRRRHQRFRGVAGVAATDAAVFPYADTRVVGRCSPAPAPRGEKSLETAPATKTHAHPGVSVSSFSFEEWLSF